MRKFLVACLLILPAIAGSCQVGELILGLPEQGRSVGDSVTLLFQDDFSDPSSGWDRSRDEDGVADYEAGAYRFLVNRANWYFWSTPGLIFGDVRIEVDAEKLSGPDINAFGVICRRQDVKNFYFFTISSDGYYGISKFQNGVELLLGMEELKPSPAIHQGTASNHLRVECVGTKLRLVVNGQQIAEVEDANFNRGDVGLIVASLDEPGVEVQFDNFAVILP